MARATKGRDEEYNKEAVHFCEDGVVINKKNTLSSLLKVVLASAKRFPIKGKALN